MTTANSSDSDAKLRDDPVGVSAAAGAAGKTVVMGSFELAAAIEKVLAGQPKKAIREALAMVATLHSLRTISIDRAIAPTGVKGELAIASTPKKGKGKGPNKVQEPAAYKADANFIKFSADRVLLVSKIKGTDDADSQKAGYVAELRVLECSLAQIKKDASASN